MERTDRFDLQRGDLFQQRLHLCAILADDVVIIPPGLRRPGARAVRSSEPKRPKASAENRIFSSLFIRCHHLRPVYHRRQQEAQPV